MSDASLLIKVGADTKDAVANVNKLTLSVGEVEHALKELKAERLTISDDAALARSNQAIAKTTDLIRNLKNVGVDGFDSVGKKAESLIERLEEGHRSLAKFERLFNGFSGGVFVEIIAKSLEYLKDALSGAESGFDKQVIATKRADEASKSLVKTLQELKTNEDIVGHATGSQAGGIETVEALAAAVTNLNLTYEERQNALNRLHKINESYFGDITLETKSLELLATRVHEYSNALIAEAVVKGFTEEISKNTIELNKQQDALDASRTKFDQAQKALKDYIKTNEEVDFSKGGGGVSGLSGSITTEQIRLQNAVADTGKAFRDQRSAVFDLATATAGYKDRLDAAIDAQLKLRPLEIAPEIKIKQPKEKDLKVKFNGVKFPLDLDTSNFDPASAIKLVQKKIDKFSYLKFPVIAGIDQSTFEDAKNKMEKLIKGLNKILSSGIGSGFADLGQSIGSAIASGVSPIEAAGRSIISTIGDLIEQIGKALLEYGIVKTGLDHILEGGIAIPGVAALALGAAAIAAGALVKALSHPQKRLAAGGVTTGPVSALIGEAGPEAIIPLSRLDRMFKTLSGGGQHVFVTVRGHVSGRNINIVSARDNKNQRMV